ncbi:putative binding protein component of ABC iron transporter precursor [Nocardioides dokdonensis FR1436]|uniref:Putative binding protein component of ABC iron transporter n=1 Tax=Nocardioides dokdonensis FR1436 TaxID=1300347 RepID=A0A1A9GKF2_9ACTN|nr:extracellular solute-binding protein [Nocardioides dokdonensis]ANH38073.1 putative binding protein component of ABC iron transporter precursor [Nocardioides dokdonensis FR1436]
MKRTALVLATAATLALSGCSALGGGDDADLQIYTARHYDLEEAFAEFTDETGITVDFLAGDDAELLERLKAEGDSTPADLFMTVDAGMLWNAAEQGVLEPIDSPVLDEAVPKDLRDPDGEWYGLAMRARTIVYAPDAVDPADIDSTDSYAALGDPRWKGRVCMRDETASYTQSLVASLIDLHGEERTQEIVESWVANDVQIMSNDVELLEAIDAGGCDIGISNHYYLARMLEEDPDFDVELFWASQDGDGTHVNISGAGLIAGTDAPEEAQQLLEWLATDGQSAFVDANHELPVNPDVEPEPLVASFGTFDRMPVDARAYGALNADAVALLDRAGYR